jgi:hypothetical protein
LACCALKDVDVGVADDEDVLVEEVLVEGVEEEDETAVVDMS